MGTRGRRPTAPALKLVKGLPGKRPLPQTPVEAAGQRAIPRPAAVERNARAADIWELTVCGAPHLRAIDTPLLAAYVLALARADEAEAQLGGALTTIGQKKNPVRHPLLAIVGQQTELARRLASDLCLGPSQRSRFDVREQPASDPAEAYFRD